MSSRDGEIMNACNLLATAEQARDELRQTMKVSEEKLIVASDKALQAGKVVVSTNKELNTQNLVLGSKYLLLP